MTGIAVLQVSNENYAICQINVNAIAQYGIAYPDVCPKPSESPVLTSKNYGKPTDRHKKEEKQASDKVYDKIQANFPNDFKHGNYTSRIAEIYARNKYFDLSTNFNITWKDRYNHTFKIDAHNVLSKYN